MMSLVESAAPPIPPVALCTRRQAIRTAAALAIAPSFGLRAFAGSTSKDFDFVVANDLHYRDARCADWLERVIARMRALRPAPLFCVLDGDLSDTGTSEQLGAVHELFRTLSMAVRPVIGNHDYTERGDRGAYERIFGAKLNARFEHGGWQFLAVDTTQARSVYRTRIGDETLGWLDRTLPDVSRRKPVVVLTHFPLGRNWLRPRNAKAVLARLGEHDLRAVLSGHWHGITERVSDGAHLSTGRCCSWWRTNHDGSLLKGFTLCRVRDGRVAHEFVAVA